MKRYCVYGVDTIELYIIQNVVRIGDSVSYECVGNKWFTLDEFMEKSDMFDKGDYIFINEDTGDVNGLKAELVHSDMVEGHLVEIPEC